MRPRFQLPMFVVAAALLGLIALLATLQYRWLGQVSDAERDRMRATLETRATEFGRDFDRELTRAYLLFQPEPSTPPDSSMPDGAELLATRYERWQATARFPRMLKDVYVASGDAGAMRLQRLNAARRTLESSEWPASMAGWRDRLGDAVEFKDAPGPTSNLMIRRIAAPVWESVPALVVPRPLVWMSDRAGRTDMRTTPDMSYVIVELDRAYLTGDLLPALAKQHLQNTGEGLDYQVAVVSAAPTSDLVYQSTPAFSPKPGAAADTTVELLQVRTQEFGAVAAEIQRFTTFTATATRPDRAGAVDVRSSTTDRIRIEHDAAAVVQGRVEMRGAAPLSIVVQQSGPGGAVGAAAALKAATTRLGTVAAPRWKLMVKHPSGSLEAAVLSARRRNLIVSTSILAVLGASVGLLLVSTRRAQTLARQQMEFVATVSHELRTPLAVIRSAGDNLADGVVDDPAQIRKYGDVVRGEGRRLTEMVEQILEFAGIHSGQRAFAMQPVDVRALLEDATGATGSLVDAEAVTVEYDLPEPLPRALGDHGALRRVFQNLVVNAVKYGGPAKWIGLRARQVGGELHVTVADRGMGIPPSEHARIFEPFYRAPDVVAAQIQGAGLGLSLVRRIVEAHGGRVTLRSAPGQGSEFTVTLPVAAPEPAVREAVPPIPPAATTRTMDAGHTRSRA